MTETSSKGYFLENVLLLTQHILNSGNPKDHEVVLAQRAHFAQHVFTLDYHGIHTQFSRDDIMSLSNHKIYKWQSISRMESINK